MENPVSIDAVLICQIQDATRDRFPATRNWGSVVERVSEDRDGPIKAVLAPAAPPVSTVFAPPPSTMLREYVIIFMASSGVTVGPADDSHVQSAGDVQADLEAQPLRLRQRMNKHLNPFGTADCRSHGHSRLPSWPDPSASTSIAPPYPCDFIASRSWVMVSSVVLPFSHHQ